MYVYIYIYIYIYIYRDSYLCISIFMFILILVFILVLIFIIIFIGSHNDPHGDPGGPFQTWQWHGRGVSEQLPSPQTHRCSIPLGVSPSKLPGENL